MRCLAEESFSVIDVVLRHDVCQPRTERKSLEIGVYDESVFPPSVSERTIGKGHGCVEPDQLSFPNADVAVGSLVDSRCEVVVRSEVAPNVVRDRAYLKNQVGSLMTPPDSPLAAICVNDPIGFKEIQDVPVNGRDDYVFDFGSADVLGH